MARLREYREAAGLSQVALASATGNTPAYISLLERGIRRNPSAIKALAITRVLSERLGREVTIAEVFDFETDACPVSPGRAVPALGHHDQQIQRAIDRAIDILRDAQARARELAQRPPGDPVMGTWYLRADQKNIYETACELALEVLSAGMAERETGRKTA